MSAGVIHGPAKVVTNLQWGTIAMLGHARPVLQKALDILK